VPPTILNIWLVLLIQDLVKIDNPPKGWSNDPEDLDYDDDWADDDSLGQRTCRYLGANGRGRPLLFHDDWDLLLFEAGGKYYIWNLISRSRYEIISTTDLNEILDLLREDRLNDLKSELRMWWGSAGAEGNKEESLEKLVMAVKLMQCLWRELRGIKE
jgi:hypothetical protein